MDFSYHYSLGYIAREIELAICPDLGCRRSGRCCRESDKLPCLKAYETLDEFRYRRSDKLRRKVLEAGGTLLPPGEEPERTYETEVKLGELKRALMERDHEITMQELRAEKRKLKGRAKQTCP